MKVYVIGTDHRLQVDDGACTHAQIDQFKKFITNICNRAQITSLAEELSKDVLLERQHSRSVCEEIANELDLTHRYCDPDRLMREVNGIREECDLHIDVFMGRLKKEDLQVAIRVEHEKREAIWLNEIRTLNNWPLLFVCGAKHARPFCALLNSAGLESDIIEEAWSPNPPLP